MADISFDDGEGLSFVHLRDGADEVEFLYNEIFVLQSYFDLKDGACVFCRCGSQHRLVFSLLCPKI